MSHTGLTFETASQEPLRQYHAHQARLQVWIDELIQRGTELLSRDTMSREHDLSGPTLSRSLRDVQTAASRFFTAAMRLSQEQLQAAIRMARLNLFQQPSVSVASASPLAQTGIEADQVAVQEPTANDVTHCHKIGSDTRTESAPTRAPQHFTPVRAAKDSNAETLMSERTSASKVPR